MLKMNKAMLGAIVAGLLGIFLATVGFWRTIMIVFLIAMGYLIGSYLETRKEE
ncbi:MAG: DUF2273 domain-containing protein [candidate division WOR-3 bacterium]|jgi:uncharacterized membrane protein